MFLYVPIMIVTQVYLTSDSLPHGIAVQTCSSSSYLSLWKLNAYRGASGQGLDRGLMKSGSHNSWALPLHTLPTSQCDQAGAPMFCSTVKPWDHIWH